MEAFSLFLALLRDISDPRRKEGRIYALEHILLFSILAIISGANSYRGIHTFIDTLLSDLNAAFGLSWKRAPAHSAIRYILKRLDPQDIERVFRKHAEHLKRHGIQSDYSKDQIYGPQVNITAIDGKVLKHSFDNLHGRKSLQILSVFSTENMLILGHIEIDDKSNEIPAAQKILSELGFAGDIVTLDAMHCQKKTFDAASSADAHLIVQLKDNQPTLREKVEALVDEEEPHSANTTRDQGHGRTEIRDVTVFDAASAVKKTEWKDIVSSVIRVNRTVYSKNSKTGLFNTTREESYYLSAKLLSAYVVSEAIRKHWCIENCNHYPRDVTFGEDASRIRVNPGVFARLRSFAYNILRINKIGYFPQYRFKIALGGLGKMLKLIVI
jgi:predicted transposase YbfD/YdcC